MPDPEPWPQERLNEQLLSDADTYGCTRLTAMACSIAEGGLYQYAERWGHLTKTAKQAIAERNVETLEWVVQQVNAGKWPHDFSWGPTQQVYLYSPLSDKSYSIQNMLLVRNWQFEPANVLPLMAQKLATYERMYGNTFAALCAYNWPGGKGQPYTAEIGGNYRNAIAQAKARFGL